MIQSNPHSGLRQSLEIHIVRSWWVVFFALLCLLFYEQMQTSRKELFSALHARLNELFAEREEALELKQDLQAHIASQSDPDYIELTLMKVLGVVPDGQIKVYFKYIHD